MGMDNKAEVEEVKGMERKELTATFDQDSKRFHRFTVDAGQEITGSIYVPKGSTVPDLINIRLMTKADKEKETQ
jgi:hypothetical protein